MKPILIAPVCLLVSLQANAFFGLFGSDDDESSTAIDSAIESVSAVSSSPLSSLLSEQLSVTPEQATSGGGALLALAQSQLSSSESSELSSLIPGLDSLTGASTLLGGVESLSAVTSAFEAVGLDASMVSQFAPVILEYLTGQGASSGLLSSLSSLWGA